jgi:hypothetical protein
MMDGVLAQTESPNFTLIDVQTNHTVQALFGQAFLCGSAITNDLVSALDTGAWQFSARAGEQVAIALTNLSSNFMPVVTFHAPNGELLTQAGAGTTSLTLTNDGIFPVLVHGVDDANTGRYVLTIRSDACTPRLHIERVDNLLTLWWALPGDGWRLEMADNLVAAPEEWTELPPPYSSDATRRYHTIPGPPTATFYRLKRE